MGWLGHWHLTTAVQEGRPVIGDVQRWASHIRCLMKIAAMTNCFVENPVEHYSRRRVGVECRRAALSRRDDESLDVSSHKRSYNLCAILNCKALEVEHSDPTGVELVPPDSIGMTRCYATAADSRGCALTPANGCRDVCPSEHGTAEGSAEVGGNDFDCEGTPASQGTSQFPAIFSSKTPKAIFHFTALHDILQDQCIAYPSREHCISPPEGPSGINKPQQGLSPPASPCCL